MASFDVTSEVNWQEVDNAINQATREVGTRFDFKGVKSEIKLDQKNRTITLNCSEEGKLEALNDVLQSKLVKRGISLLSLEYGKEEPSSGSSVRQVITVQNGISKEKGKEIVKAIKDGKFKVQAQIQDEQVRVTAKKRDMLQEVISFLKEKQDKLQIPLQFGNYRD